MRNIRQIISKRVSDALVATLGDEGSNADPVVRGSQDARFGDYQSNCAMGLAKKLGRKPRELAEQIAARLEIGDVCEPPEIAGPGFINLTLKHEFLAAQLEGIPPALTDGVDRLGIDKIEQPEVIAVDMSSPNLAKEMHVGHLRPTIIGDCVARILEFQGHEVHRINHVGDWGTQFGMLIERLQEKGWVPPRKEPRAECKPPNGGACADALPLGTIGGIKDLEVFYVEAKARFDTDPDFRERARQAVVRLQSGDADTLHVWRLFCDESLRHCHEIYDLLDVRIEDRGESFYNDKLPGVVQELREKGLAVESDGAICIFPEGFTNKEGKPLPLIVQKSDGGYGYATTDLAALKHRLQTLGATQLVYVVGSSQKLHFEMLFTVLAKTGWAGAHARAMHIPTGILLKADGTPFKTSEGGTVKLRDLLDEAVARSRSFLEANEKDADRHRGYNPEQIAEMSSVIGLAAVKYFELSHNPTSDYRFDWDIMLALDGNTAPYMLYAYARIQSIAKKAAGASPRTGGDAATHALIIEHASEIGLARQLLKFVEVLEQLGRDLRPNLLTEYLFELSKAFSTFYDRKTGVRVIDAESEQIRQSRLRLCDLTGRTLKVGLGLLGISMLERM